MISSSSTSSKAYLTQSSSSYVKNLDDGIPYFAATLTMMKTYDLAKQMVDCITIPPGPTALSTVVSTKLTCPVRKNLYPAVKRRDTGEFFFL
jgi:hypothetical protein